MIGGDRAGLRKGLSRARKNTIMTERGPEKGLPAEKKKKKSLKGDGGETLLRCIQLGTAQHSMQSRKIAVKERKKELLVASVQKKGGSMREESLVN